jgi:hypothetical protein
MDFLKAIASKLAGPGAYEEPIDAFKLYAPPSLWDAYTPEQQAAYGRQIQSQQRSINADYRPKYQDVQKGIAEDYANRATMDATAAMKAERIEHAGTGKHATLILRQAAAQQEVTQITPRMPLSLAEDTLEGITADAIQLVQAKPQHVISIDCAVQ